MVGSAVHYFSQLVSYVQQSVAPAFPRAVVILDEAVQGLAKIIDRLGAQAQSAPKEKDVKSLATGLFLKRLQTGKDPDSPLSPVPSKLNKFVTLNKTKTDGAATLGAAAPPKNTADAEVQTDPASVVAVEQRHTLEVSGIFGPTEDDVKKDPEAKKHPSRFWAGLLAGTDGTGGNLGAMGAQQAADEAQTLFDDLIKTWRESGEHERQSFTPLKRVRALYLSKYGTIRAAERHLLTFMVQSNNLPRPPFKCTALARMCEYAKPELLYSADTMCLVFSCLEHVSV
jgi:hypothetical protein